MGCGSMDLLVSANNTDFSQPESQKCSQAAKTTVQTATKITQFIDTDGNIITEYRNDPERRTKEIKFQDKNQNGILKQTEYSKHPDHVTLVKEYLNRIEKIFDHGAMQTEYTPGDRRNPEPGLFKVYESASGDFRRREYYSHIQQIRTITEYKDPKENIKLHIHRQDGSNEFEYRDGSTKKYDAKGNIIIPRKR